MSEVHFVNGENVVLSEERRSSEERNLKVKTKVLVFLRLTMAYGYKDDKISY